MRMNEEVFQLSDDWGKLKYHDRIVVYGMGRIGRRVLPVLQKEFEVSFLIDNRCTDEIVSGLKVLGVSEGVLQAKEEGIKIVVTTMRGAYDEIAPTLVENGLKENADFCIFERFAQEWNLRWQNKCVLAKIDTVITSRCTLKCRNCNIFISHIVHHQDISLEDLKKNFDIFFDSVDFVYEYTLLGGEPFRHEKIKEIIEYLAEVYGDRIGKINLISNGTIVPGEKILSVLSQYHVSVHISDYTSAVAYSAKLDEVRKTLTDYGIEYYVIPNNTWKDIVYPDLSYTADEPREHMLSCGHSTHSVGNGRIYWCDPAFAAEFFVGFESKDDDYLDLQKNKEQNSKRNASLNILNYLLGEVNDRGYMSICEKCAGIGRDNDRIVKAGEQGEKSE